MAIKPANLLYGVDEKPPLQIIIILAIQHIFFLTSGLIVATIVMREVGGSHELINSVISMAMIAGGIATIIQALGKGPFGSGYLCTEGIDPTFISTSILAGTTGGISLIFGITIVSGVIECLLSRVIHKLRILFPPEVTGVVLAMVGLNIIPIMMTNFFSINSINDPVETNNVLVAVITLFFMVATNVWSKGKLRLYSVIIGMVIGYIAAYVLGVLKPSDIDRFSYLPIIAFPDLSYISWSFNTALLVPILVATIASTLKGVATLTMCQKVNDAEWKRPDLENIGKGTFADGIASILGGLMGGLGQSLYAASVGLSMATGATSRVIAFFTGGIFIGLAFLPKLTAIFSIMPKPVMGGALLFMVSFMVISGIQIMTSRMIDIRKTFVIAISLIFGISVDIFPSLYRNVHPYLQPFFSSSLAVTTLLAMFLNLLFRIGISKREFLELIPGVDSSRKIFDFMENQGAAWGGRSEVFQKAKMAVNEFLEAVPSLNIQDEKIIADVFFDEFNLDITIHYHGIPMEFPLACPSPDEILDDDTAGVRLAGYLVKQYADEVKIELVNSQCVLKIHFDH
ncbi:MAG: hypothetical protein CSYNP_01006 [Syntrophus sp. SKADARSKE-3]|nr:hypothetical protein [Syntrophus sp. SKADARSKE-3]